MANFANYPLVQKAYEEQEDVARFLGGSLGPEYQAAVAGFVEAADTLLDGTAAEKEAVIVACILFTGSRFIFDDTSRFETEYSPEVNELVELILNLDEETLAGSAPLQQALAIIVVTSIPRLIEQIRQGNAPAGIENVRSKEDLVKAPGTLLEETAPRLYAATDKACMAALDAIVEYRASRPDGGSPENPPKPGF